jgi:hypothetical protein
MNPGANLEGFEVDLPGYSRNLPNPLAQGFCTGLTLQESETLFFPSRNEDKGRAAYNFCRGGKVVCPVADKCAEYGLVLSGGYGIWGGYVGGDASHRNYTDGRTKLNANLVYDIRARADAKDETGDTWTSIARDYGVSKDTVRSIGLRRRWGNLPERRIAA